MINSVYCPSFYDVNHNELYVRTIGAEAGDPLPDLALVGQLTVADDCEGR